MPNVFCASFYLLVIAGYLVDTSGYLVVTSGYLIATSGYFCTAWKVSRYGVFSGPYFPAFELNTERLRENTDQKKLRISTLFTQCWLLLVTSCCFWFLVLVTALIETAKNMQQIYRRTPMLKCSTFTVSLREY